MPSNAPRVEALSSSHDTRTGPRRCEMFSHPSVDPVGGDGGGCPRSSRCRARVLRRGHVIFAAAKSKLRLRKCISPPSACARRSAFLVVRDRFSPRSSRADGSQPAEVSRFDPIAGSRAHATPPRRAFTDRPFPTLRLLRRLCAAHFFSSSRTTMPKVRTDPRRDRPRKLSRPYPTHGCAERTRRGDARW